MKSSGNFLRTGKWPSRNSGSIKSGQKIHRFLMLFVYVYSRGYLFVGPKNIPWRDRAKKGRRLLAWAKPRHGGHNFSAWKNGWILWVYGQKWWIKAIFHSESDVKPVTFHQIFISTSAKFGGQVPMKLPYDRGNDHPAIATILIRAPRDLAYVYIYIYNYIYIYTYLWGKWW